MDQLVCFWGASASVYKGAKGEGAAGQGGRAKGVLLPLEVGFPLPPPPNPSWNRIRGGGKEKEGAGHLS